MNKWIGMGRLTADPVVRSTQDGKMVAAYTLAVNRPAARQESKADFINVKAWEKRAEFAEKYLCKGMKIVVVGRIQTGSYKDRDGRTVYTTDIVADEQEFCEAKGKTENIAEAPADDFMKIPDDDPELPFN